MLESEKLFACEDPTVWREMQRKYCSVLEAKSTGKGKVPGKLLELDKCSSIAARSECFLTRAELVKIMEWKLMKGKFRPRLQQLIGSNVEELVQSSSKKAFSLLPDVQAAITELCKLKGVGPATASAILAAGAPDKVAFMADEAVESIAELRPVQYTAKHYARYLQKMLDKASQLNTVDTQQEWTPQQVQRCLWTCAVANQIQPSLLEELNLTDTADTVSKRKPDKRKTDEGRPSKRKKIV
ncbi:hypothetical protein DNTS_025168 [Danionella cerebrum]|uniref:Uncharacterized protein n=1 Tax=Danionella cerebrum TaxID=2873325 RepID=A0A553QST9_9TELE|nr:hypothetical protein DNTS_025168 [Danionella translucida]